MSFYRRGYGSLPSALNTPSLLNTPPAAVAARVDAKLPGRVLSVRVPLPASFSPRVETLRFPPPLPPPVAPLPPQVQPVLAFDPRSFPPAPVEAALLDSTKVAAAAAAGDRAARAAAKEASGRAARAAAVAQESVRNARAAVKEAGARAYEMNVPLSPVAVPLPIQATLEAEKAIEVAVKAGREAEKKTREAEKKAREAEKAAETDAPRPPPWRKTGTCPPGATWVEILQGCATDPLPSGGGGGGGDVPWRGNRRAWDQPEEEIETVEEVPLPEGTTALVVTKRSSPLLAAAAAGAAGFFLGGGPIGAVIGAAAGYFLGRPKRVAAQVSRW